MFLKKSLKKSLKKGHPKALNSLFLFFLGFYKAFLSPFMGGACRFYPSCSLYAQHVYKTQNFFKATGLVIRRLLSCQPFGPLYRQEPELESFFKKPNPCLKQKITS